MKNNNNATIITIEHLRLFICPLCHKEISNMEFIITKANIEVKVTCTNLKPPLTKTYSLEDYINKSNCIEHSQLGVEFCVNCDKWLCRQCIPIHESNSKYNKHNYLSCNSLLYCQKHTSQSLQYYSSDLKQFCCFECTKDPKNKHCVLLKKPDLKIDNDKIKAIEDSNKQLKKSFITALDLLRTDSKEGSDIGISDIKFDKMKDTIEFLYQKNFLFNADLLVLFKALETALSIMKPYYNYQLNELYSVFQLNNTSKIVLSKTNIRHDYKTLKAYFNNEYLFTEKIKLKKLINNHTDWVCSLVQFNNNAKFASGGADNEISVYNSHTLKNEATFKRRHYLAVIYLIQLKDGRLLSSSDDCRIIAWNAFSYQLLTLIHAHKSSVYCLVELHNKNIASCSGDGTIKILHHHLFNCIATLKGHTLQVRYVIQLSDLTIASGSDDKSIKIWDIITKECKATLSDKVLAFSHLCLLQLPDTQLASGTSDGVIMLWNTHKYQINTVIRMSSSCSIRSLYLLKNKYILSGSGDKRLRIWSAVTFQCLYTIVIHTDTVRCFAYIGGNRLVTGSYDKSIKIWDLNFLSST